MDSLKNHKRIEGNDKADELARKRACIQMTQQWDNISSRRRANTSLTISTIEQPDRQVHWEQVQELAIEGFRSRQRTINLISVDAHWEPQPCKLLSNLIIKIKYIQISFDIDCQRYLYIFHFKIWMIAFFFIANKFSFNSTCYWQLFWFGLSHV